MNDKTLELSFEEALAELQSAVEELRGDALTLDRSLALYERGMSLAGHCETLLTRAELRITQTTPRPATGDQGSFSTADAEW